MSVFGRVVLNTRGYILFKRPHGFILNRPRVNFLLGLQHAQWEISFWKSHPWILYRVIDYIELDALILLIGILNHSVYLFINLC